MSIRFLPEVQEIVKKMTLQNKTRDAILKTLKADFGKAYRPTDLSRDMAMYRFIELKIDKEKYTKKYLREKWDFLLVIKTHFIAPLGYTELNIRQNYKLKKSQILERIRDYPEFFGKKLYFELEIYVGKNLKDLETIFLKNDMMVTSYLTGIGKRKEIAAAILTILQEYGTQLVGDWRDKMIESAEKLNLHSYKKLVQEMI